VNLQAGTRIEHACREARLLAAFRAARRYWHLEVQFFHRGTKSQCIAESKLRIGGFSKADGADGLPEGRNQTTANALFRMTDPIEELPAP
jgi:hypothetical protein